MGQTSTLDWTTILVRLFEQGYIVPGPIVGRASYWMLTSKYDEWYPGMRYDIARIVGEAWTDAVMNFIYSSAISGPRLANPWRLESNPPERPPRGSSYAFRLLDEPTPWLRSTRPKRKLVAGRAPDRWRSVPWIVPRDLQDRASRFDHSPVVNEDATSRQIEDAERIETINAGLSTNLNGEALLKAIRELDTIAKRVGQLPGITSRASVIINKAWAFFDEVAEKVIRERLQKARSDSSNEWFDEIEGWIAEIKAPNIRRPLEDLFSATRARVRPRER